MSMKDSDVSRAVVNNSMLAMMVLIFMAMMTKIKKLTEIIQFIAEKYDRLVELYEELEGDRGSSFECSPGFQELSDILDKLKDENLVENSKYWSDR